MFKVEDLLKVSFLSEICAFFSFYCTLAMKYGLPFMHAGEKKYKRRKIVEMQKKSF